MSDLERLEQFRAVLLAAMNLFRETRKDIFKLQTNYLAMRMFLLSTNPSIESEAKKELDGFVKEAENRLADQKSDVETEFEKVLGEVIGLLELNHRKKED